MYALVLAGGFATRLWPITHEYPKPLLPIGSKRIIEHVLEKIWSARIEHIFVSTNRAFEKQFIDWLNTSPFISNKNLKEKITLIVEPTFSEDTKFGAIRGIQYDLEVIKREYGYRDMLIVAGDNIFSLDINNFLDFFRELSSPVVAAYKLGNIDRAKQYGVVEIDDTSRIKYFVEKPKKPKTELISTAIYALPSEDLKYFHMYLSQKNNPDAPGFFFQWLIKQVDVYAYVFSGYWFDIGTLDGYLDALRQIMTGKYIGEKSIVKGKIIPPVFIGSGSYIDKKSVVGPYVVIGNNVKIFSSKIQSTLILDDTSIESTTISNSMIGEKSVIRGGSISKSILGKFTKLNLT